MSSTNYGNDATGKVKAGGLNKITVPVAAPQTGSSTCSSVSSPQTPFGHQTNAYNFKTPSLEKKKIRNWIDLHISPTKMARTFDQAQRKMHDDGIADMMFYISGSEKLKRSVYFLYGINFKADAKKEDRIQSILNCVGNKGSLERLSSIAFSDPLDLLLFPTNTVEEYCLFATTYYLVFKGFVDDKVPTKKLCGGFPECPFQRFQKSRNSFQLASCAHVSLLQQYYHRKDFVQRYKEQNYEEENYLGMVDTAHCARRFLLTNDKALEERVCKNNGSITINLAAKVSGKSHVSKVSDFGSPWSTIDFGDLEQSIDVKELHLFSSFQMYQFGLVTEFWVHPPFHTVERMKERGYYKFDGNNVDVVGKWISLEEHRTPETDEFECKYREMQADQLKSAKTKQASIDEKLHGFFPAGTSENLPDVEHASEVKKAQEKGTHSMVLLGCLQDEGKRLYMMLNWWRKMPLVLVSAEYLRACKAKVSFLTVRPDAAKDLIRNHNLVADWVSPYGFEVGDGVSAHSWFSDGLGMPVAIKKDVDPIEAAMELCGDL